jgi:ABC-2 type transport system permease protein
MIWNSRIFAVMHKEFIHIINDKITLGVVILLPIFQLIIFGYALNMELQNVQLQIIDQDHSIASHNFSEEFSHNKYFTVSLNPKPIMEAYNEFLSGKTKAILIIPKDFSSDIKRRSVTDVQLLIDSSDPNAASLVRIYSLAVVNSFNTKYGMKNNGLNTVPRTVLPFKISHSVWYNPDLKSSYFFVPGLLAMLLVMISALLTSIALTREKELGTMEQILVSPIRSGEIIFGKVLPYILLAFLDACLVLVVGIFLFHIPFNGSIFLCALLTILYIITALSLGILISTIAKSQQTALMFALVATLLPTIMLSGFIFPIRSMPIILQGISYLVPARYFLMIVRGILIKGNTLNELYGQAIFLFIMSSFMLSVAWKRFKTHS